MIRQDVPCLYRTVNTKPMATLRNIICQRHEDVKTRRVLVRMSADEWASIMQAAALYADGNVSLWLRYAALHWRPKAKDLDMEDGKKKKGYFLRVARKFRPVQLPSRRRS